MPIDFSKINLSVLPKGGNVVKAPPKKGRIDYGAIKLGNIYITSAVKTTPKPVAISAPPTSFTGRPLVTPVEQRGMKAAIPAIPKNQSNLYAPSNQPTQTTLEVMDSFNAAIQGLTPHEPGKVNQYGRNTIVDFVGSLATVAFGLYEVKSLVGAVKNTAQWNKYTKLGSEVSTRLDELQKTDQNLTNAGIGKIEIDGNLVAPLQEAGARAAADLTMVNGRAVIPNATAKLDGQIRILEAARDLLNSAHLAEVGTGTTNAIAIPAGAFTNLSSLTPGVSSNALALQGVSQLGAAALGQNPVRVPAIPMPAGLVHSTAPAIPMGDGTLPVPTSLQTPAPVVAPVAKPAPAVPNIIAKKGQVPAFTTPRPIDKTIPAFDVKKANLVDVTGKVDLKSIQVKYPKTDTVVLDTKRRVVMFMHGTTPLEAVGVDKPQLNEWYGIEGAKLLGGATQPVAPVVAQVAPTLSKMETPAAVKQPWEITREEFISAEPKRAGTKGQAYQAGVQHSLSVKQAIAEGKPVPTEVLADYPDLSTTPQKGTATTISNQKTSIDTSPAVSLQGEAKTGASAVKWGKWIDAVGSRRTSGVGTGQVDTIKTPVTYRLGSGEVSFRSYANGDEGLWKTNTGKALQLKGDPHTYYIRTIEEDNPKYNQYVVIEARSGMGMGRPAGTVKNAIANAQEQALAHKADFDGIIGEAVTKNGDANPASVPTNLLTSTSAPAAAPSLGNATPAHGLIDYSKIELNGTTSVTSPAVLKSVSNTGKGFENYIQNIPGTTKTSLSLATKLKEIRDGYIRFIANEYNWFFKSPLGGEWMTIAVAADDLILEEYKNPFYIDDAGEQVFVGGEFGPAILARYLKQYGPNFGKFLQHLQRAGISTEPTLGLSAEKEALKQLHIANARTSLVNFQKNDPQLSKAYMAAAHELGEANRLLPEFYKGITTPETYASEKAYPNYYVSLSAGKTDIFDRSGVAPLERARGLTNLDEVVPPLEGLISVYIDAIRAQGINNAKKEAVKSSKSAEVATTVLSDSIVHLKENGVDRAYEVHDKDAGASIRNLTRSKWEVPSLVKKILTAPTTLLRVTATGINIAFGAFNPVRDIIQAAGLVPFTPEGLVKGTVKAFKSPGLSQWSKDYRDPTRATGTKVTEAVKKIVEFVSIPSNVGEALSRDVIAESIGSRGGTYLDQFYGYHAGTGFFALHGTIFNDFISSLIPFTRATIAVIRAAYRNAFFGLPIGGKGGTFSGKQGAEKILGKNFLATIIFTILSIMGIKAAGKEKEYKLLRNRASFFYLPQPSGDWVKLPVPIGSAPIKAIVESLFGYKSDPISVAGQTLNVIPGLEAFMLPPALTLYLQYEFNVNFFTGAPISTSADTPPANPLEAAIMKLGYTEEQVSMALRAFFADIPSQVQYVFEMVTQGSSTQAFPASKRFIVKDPTTSSNAAVDDFYALVDATSHSKNPALEHYVNARASVIGKLLHNAKAYPADAKIYVTTATDNIIATFAVIAENPETYGIKKFGPFSWRPSGNYEELAP